MIKEIDNQDKTIVTIIFTIKISKNNRDLTIKQL